jgi:hypothetical protein
MTKRNCSVSEGVGMACPEGRTIGRKLLGLCISKEATLFAPLKGGGEMWPSGGCAYGLMAGMAVATKYNGLMGQLAVGRELLS